MRIFFEAATGQSITTCADFAATFAISGDSNV
jgi:hypothetical protein